MGPKKKGKYLLMFLVLVLPILFLPATKELAYTIFLHSSIYKKTVPLISAEEISLSNDVLLDIRTQQEFAVSHLPNAQFIDFESFQLSNLPPLDRDQKIVVYCSVGYRSERIGEKLKEAGFTNVHNLEGGIFSWINQELEVVDSAGTTQNIHPFNEDWGFWLTKGNQVIPD